MLQVRRFTSPLGLSTSQLIVIISPGSACVPSPISVLQYCPPNSMTEHRAEEKNYFENISNNML